MNGTEIGRFILAVRLVRSQLQAGDEELLDEYLHVMLQSVYGENDAAMRQYANQLCLAERFVKDVLADAGCKRRAKGALYDGIEKAQREICLPGEWDPETRERVLWCLAMDRGLFEIKTEAATPSGEFLRLRSQLAMKLKRVEDLELLEHRFYNLFLTHSVVSWMCDMRSRILAQKLDGADAASGRRALSLIARRPELFPRDAIFPRAECYTFIGPAPYALHCGYETEDLRYEAMMDDIRGALLRMREIGAEYMITGLEEGVDLWAAQLAAQWRQEEDSRMEIFPLCYERQTIGWPEESKDLYYELLRLSFVPYNDEDQCLLTRAQRDDALLDMAQHVIIMRGDARCNRLYREAKARKKDVIKLNPQAK